MFRNPTSEAPRSANRENINPGAERPMSFGAKAEGIYNGMAKPGKIIASRIYEGSHQISFFKRIVARMGIAFSQKFMNRHEKKAVGLKGQLDSLDLILNNFDQSKSGIESAIEDLRQQGMPGGESLRLQLKKIDQERSKVLGKRDKIQSKFEARENKMRLYANSRDAIADKLIGHFDEKLRPMEANLSYLQDCRERADVTIAVMETRHAKTVERLNSLEEKKNNLAESLAMSGMSERKVRRNGAIKVMDDLIEREYRKMQGEKESIAQRKMDIDRKVAILSKKSNPYRDKREIFARIKEGRPLDMGVETRTRSAGFDGREDVRGHAREIQGKSIISNLGVNGNYAADPENVVAPADASAETATGDPAAAGKDDEENKKGPEPGRDAKVSPAAPAEEQQGQKNAVEKKMEEHDAPIRAAAWHTISKLEGSKDFTYADLNGATQEERDENFKKITRAVWDDFTVHGFARLNKKTGKWEVEKKSDLDGNSCLKLMELAGMKVDMGKVNFVAQGQTAESGIVMDTSEKHGIMSDKDGKRVIIDHHGTESDRSTSATKFVYETLLGLGLLDKDQQAYLDKYVEFVTKNDNLDFGSDEKEIYANYYKNIYGLASKMDVNSVLEFIKQGVDPKADLPEDYLKNNSYVNSGTGKKETLAQFSEFLKKQMEYAQRDAEKVEKRGFVLDTGNRFGKVLIDTMKKAGNDRWYSRVNGDGSSRQLSVFEKGYGAYVVWSPEENKFFVYTKNVMDEQAIPGGFSQGKNMRGHMLISGAMNKEKVKPEFLQEILAKLSGKDDFKIEGRLKKALDIDNGAKTMLDLLDGGNFTQDVLKKTADDLGVSTKDLLDDMIWQRNLGSQFQKKLKAQPDDKKTTQDRINISMEVLSEYQSKKVGTGQPATVQASPQAAAQPTATPPNQPPVPPTTPQQAPTPQNQPASQTNQPAAPPVTPPQVPQVPSQPAIPPNQPPNPSTTAQQMPQTPNQPATSSNQPANPSATVQQMPNQPGNQASSGPVAPQQPPNQPAQMPAPAVEQFDSARLEDEFKKISSDFGINVQYDQIVNEKNNSSIIESLREALQMVDYKKISGLVKTVALSRKRPQVSSSGDNIILQYDLSTNKMAKQLTALAEEAIIKQNEIFKKQYDIKPEYNEIFRNVKSQMDRQNVAREAQQNFFAVLKDVVENYNVKESNKRKLEKVEFDFDVSTDSSTKYFDNIKFIIIEDNKLLVMFGTETNTDPSKGDIAKMLEMEVKNL